MSSAGGAPDDFTPDSATRLNATIGIAAFIVIFGCVAFFITLDLCLRVLVRRYTGIIPLGRSVQQQQGTGVRVNLLNKGLDEAVINTLLPVFIYGGDNNTKGGAAECAVCLSEFEDGERGRVLPKCSHAFHADCIDMWFQSHSTCPICRSAVVDDAAPPPPPNPSSNAAATIVVNGSEIPAPIQVASSPDEAPVVIVIPRLDEANTATAASSSSPRSSSFHSVIDISVVSSGKEASAAAAEPPMSPVVAATLGRLRSLGRLWSRRDLANEQPQPPLPSPRL